MAELTTQAFFKIVQGHFITDKSLRRNFPYQSIAFAFRESSGSKPIGAFTAETMTLRTEHEAPKK
ncbi:hypothetical protein [Caballeronia mineralivorans]|jgi:hypothetical protein|uniref:hypothetical protein n=1 Tax=Caballeronia mineralivorans TaxID=2010198 RepID=UPI0023F2D0AF|nr:hypothetical protein [Caballeronia mineralivorans]